MEEALIWYAKRPRQQIAENLMTIAHTARKQKRNVLAFLTESCEAARSKGCSPSLFDAAAV